MKKFLVFWMTCNFTSRVNFWIALWSTYPNTSRIAWTLLQKGKYHLFLCLSNYFKAQLEISASLSLLSNSSVWLIQLGFLLPYQTLLGSKRENIPHAVFSLGLSNPVQVKTFFNVFLNGHFLLIFLVCSFRHFNNIKKHITDNLIPKSAQDVIEGFKHKLR